MDPRTRRKLRDFSRALSDAIADSEEAARRLKQLRREGYTFYLLIGGDGGATDGCDEELGPGSRRDESTVPTNRALQLSRRQLPARRSPQRPPLEREPTFRINGGDVALLRSLGIDPTRPAGGRRRR